MDDSRIVELYWERNEDAITATGEKYGKYCHKVAFNILANDEDSNECVNDTYLAAWNSMPTNRPTLLGAYLASIIRNLALDLYRKNHAKRRGEGQVDVALDELTEVIGNSSTQDAVESKLLAEAINSFLASEKVESRVIFVRRYFYMDSLDTIGERMGISEGKIKSSLFRTRARLREYLVKEGYMA